VTVVPETSYLFLSNTNPEYGAYVNVEVTAEETATSPFDPGSGTWYLYTYNYWVDNTGPKSGEFDFAIDVIDNLSFFGGAIESFNTIPSSGNAAVTLAESPAPLSYGYLQFDFEGGLAAGQISDHWSITSYFANELLSAHNLPSAILSDSGQTSYGDLTSDLLVPGGSAITQAPEPGTLLLVGGGLLAFAALRFRRNRKKTS
jgi:hypothetical protein